VALQLVHLLLLLLTAAAGPQAILRRRGTRCGQQRAARTPGLLHGRSFLSSLMCPDHFVSHPPVAQLDSQELGRCVTRHCVTLCRGPCERPCWVMCTVVLCYVTCSGSAPPIATVLTECPPLGITHILCNGNADRMPSENSPLRVAQIWLGQAALNRRSGSRGTLVERLRIVKCRRPGGWTDGQE
jgi:hypothetical protein